jgi:hypothetical protein
MNDVYVEWLNRMPVYSELRPRDFMALLILELNRIHGTWTRRASVLRVSRLSYMNWNRKLKSEMGAVQEAFRSAKGDSNKVVEILMNKERV